MAICCTHQWCPMSKTGFEQEIEKRTRTKREKANAQQFHHWLGTHISIVLCCFVCLSFVFRTACLPYARNYVLLQLIACFLIILCQLRNEWIFATHKMEQITITLVQANWNFCNSLYNWIFSAFVCSLVFIFQHLALSYRIFHI